MELTLYAILDVLPDADPATIAQSYVARIGEAVTNPTVDRSTLTYAYLVLSDPARRTAYNTALRRAKEARGENVIHRGILHTDRRQ